MVANTEGDDHRETHQSWARSERDHRLNTSGTNRHSGRGVEATHCWERASGRIHRAVRTQRGTARSRRALRRAWPRGVLAEASIAPWSDYPGDAGVGAHPRPYLRRPRASRPARRCGRISSVRAPVFRALRPPRVRSVYGRSVALRASSSSFGLIVTIACLVSTTCGGSADGSVLGGGRSFSEKDQVDRRQGEAAG